MNKAPSPYHRVIDEIATCIPDTYWVRFSPDIQRALKGAWIEIKIKKLEALKVKKA